MVRSVRFGSPRKGLHWSLPWSVNALSRQRFAEQTGWWRELACSQPKELRRAWDFPGHSRSFQAGCNMRDAVALLWGTVHPQIVISDCSHVNPKRSPALVPHVRCLSNAKLSLTPNPATGGAERHANAIRLFRLESVRKFGPRRLPWMWEEPHSS